MFLISLLVIIFELGTPKCFCSTNTNIIHHLQSIIELAFHLNLLEIKVKLLWLVLLVFRKRTSSRAVLAVLDRPGKRLAD